MILETIEINAKINIIIHKDLKIIIDLIELSMLIYFYKLSEGF